eukprot:COSAG06_NODE_45538_length_354_cov_0.603922_1_plen_64_part_01
MCLSTLNSGGGGTVSDSLHQAECPVDLLQENGLFFEFSLCLSRAYLGKLIIFMYKWLKKTVFLP